MDAKGWCACGDFGDQANPRQLMQVLGHRRHRKHPECEQPPFLINEEGSVVRADYPIRTAAEQAARRADAAAKRAAKEVVQPTAPLEDDAPSLAGDDSTPQGGSRPFEYAVPDTPMGAPPTLTGKAAMPAPDPKTGLPTPAPLFALSIKITAGVAQLWDWTLAQGFTGTFDDWVDQSIKACYRDLVGIAPMIVPVEAA